ncbi:uncharacterized protein DUF4214 [Sphingomonas sp. PP-F2F-G114-C0414]|nr:uncharacterized protein DUF4214 [Sphingomonas sp. PP-F2F-G114-C0414]
MIRYASASLAIIATLVCSTSQAAAAIPGQYISKLYTEALGRTPDSTGWNGMVNYFTANGCTVAALKAQGATVLGSQEFASQNYSNSAKILLAYRTILDREPDLGGFNANVNALNSGSTFDQIVNSFYGSSEFASLTRYICSGNPYYFEIQSQNAYAIQPPGTAIINQAQLQAQLNAAGSGNTVSLPQMAVIYLSSTLSIPNGVRLTTAGNPTPASHGFMARLIRAPNFSSNAAVVQLQPGAALTSIWVDGQRGAAPYASGVPRPFVHTDINIQTLSGTGTNVSSNFIANTVGWSSLQIFGSAEVQNTPCRANVINGNTITVYGSSNSDNAGSSWADGISDSCEDSTVTNNNIADASDGGIVLFRSQVPGAGAVQRSQVTDNVILNAGNSAFVGIAVDPLYVSGGCPASPSFSGSYVGRNKMWTSSNATIEIGLAVGTSEWFYSAGGCKGTGANVSDNTTAGIRSRFNVGIAVEGMLNATVQSNDFLTARVRKGRCQSADVAAGISAGLASGSIQPYSDIALTDCIN